MSLHFFSMFSISRPTWLRIFNHSFSLLICLIDLCTGTGIVTLSKLLFFFVNEHAMCGNDSINEKTKLIIRPFVRFFKNIWKFNTPTNIAIYQFVSAALLKLTLDCLIINQAGRIYLYTYPLN